MAYAEVKFQITQRYQPLLISELDQLGFDSFLEEDKVLSAYIEEQNLDVEALKQLKNRLSAEISFEYEIGKLEEKNWNEEWEKNYEPVRIDNEVYIRAHFHPTDPSVKHEILITPQMSFGTGHHSTTELVIRAQLRLNHQGADVLDAGCGTGVLAIMASKLGARSIDAYDIDEWAYTNSQENFSNNNISNIRLFQGDVSVVRESNKQYGIILANINKNVLLKDVPDFARILLENGYLVLSGFYEKDVKDLQQLAGEFHLELSYQESKKDWTCLVFIKRKG